MDALAFLKREGFAVPPSIVTNNEEEAVRWAKGRYPVVVKVAEGLSHKTDKGAVVLDNYTPEALRQAFKSLRKRFPKAKLLVQQQVRGALEVYMGVKKDPLFGHIFLLGLGGIYVELLKALSYRPCPLSRADVEEMLSETPLGRAVEGFRGKAYDKEALVRAAVKLSQKAVEWDVEEMDINPLLLKEKGYAIVDARIVK